MQTLLIKFPFTINQVSDTEVTLNLTGNDAPIVGIHIHPEIVKYIGDAAMDRIYNAAVLDVVKESIRTTLTEK